jgi:hypothetical protein
MNMTSFLLEELAVIALLLDEIQEAIVNANGLMEPGERERSRANTLFI